MQSQRETKNPNPTARIIVADDYAPWRAQVRNILRARPDWQILCEVCDGSQAVLKAAELRPDVVILDIAMPVMNGIEAAEMIRRGVPDCKILFLTNYEDSDMKTAALQGGAEGYVLKSQAGSDLLPSIVAALPPDTITNSELRTVPYRQQTLLSARATQNQELRIPRNRNRGKPPALETPKRLVYVGREDPENE